MTRNEMATALIELATSSGFSVSFAVIDGRGITTGFGRTQDITLSKVKRGARIAARESLKWVEDAGPIKGENDESNMG